MPSIDEYPDVVIHEIAKRLDYSTIRSMKQTNRRMHAALSDPLLWIDLCERDQVDLPSRTFRKNLADQAKSSADEGCVGQMDFERIWAKNPFRRNLAPPMLPSFDEMSREYGWSFSNNSQFRRGDQSNRMIVEEPPAGCEHHPEIDRCFATSYSWGERLMKINLVKQGVPEWVLDHIRPRIIISELVAPRFDCASEYQMHGQLLQPGEAFKNGSYQDAAHSRFKVARKQWEQWTNPAHWERVELVFADYPIGVREISVLSRGKDSQFWAGQYGAKFANLEIRLEMDDEVRWLSEADFPDVKIESSDEPPFLSTRAVSGRPGGFFGRFRRLL